MTHFFTVSGMHYAFIKDPKEMYMSPSVCPWAIVMVGIMGEDCSANAFICIS